MEDKRSIQHRCRKCGAKANVQSFRVSTPGVAPVLKAVCASCGHQQDLEDPPKNISDPAPPSR